MSSLLRFYTIIFFILGLVVMADSCFKKSTNKAKYLQFGPFDNSSVEYGDSLFYTWRDSTMRIGPWDHLTGFEKVSGNYHLIILSPLVKPQIDTLNDYQ